MTNDSGMVWSDTESSWVRQTNPEIEEAEKATGNWLGSAFSFGSSLLNNSGQIASIFSPSYREDQIALAQAQNQGSTKSGIANQNNNNLFIIIGVVVAVIILLVVLLNRKK